MPERVVVNRIGSSTVFSGEDIRDAFNWGTQPHYNLVVYYDGSMQISHAGVLANVYSFGGGPVSKYTVGDTWIRYFYKTAKEGGIDNQAYIQVFNDLSYEANDGAGMVSFGRCRQDFYDELPPPSRSG